MSGWNTGYPADQVRTHIPWGVVRGDFVSWERVLGSEIAHSILIDAHTRKDRTTHKLYGDFASPGGYQTLLENVALTDDGIRFAAPGSYNLFTSAGMFKFLVLPANASFEDHVVAAGTFVSENSLHMHLNTLASVTPPTEWRRYIGWGALLGQADLAQWLRTLFRSDQPLGLYCGQLSKIMCVLLAFAGISVRSVSMKTERGGSHIVIEARHPETGQWIMVDCDFGFMARGADGQFLSLQQIHDRVDGIEFVRLGRKARINNAFRLPPVASMSGISWRPEMSLDEDMASIEKYAEVIGGPGSKRTYHRAAISFRSFTLVTEYQAQG